MSRNRVIGKNNGLPWDLPDEMAYFRSTTLEKPVIMGRKTFQTVGKPLPRRPNIVMSRQDFESAGVHTTRNIEEALNVAATYEVSECFVIGGAEIYVAALPYADRLYCTEIHADLCGDTFFPMFDFANWKCVSEEHHPSDARHEYAFTMRVFEKTE